MLEKEFETIDKCLENINKSIDILCDGIERVFYKLEEVEREIIHMKVNSTQEK